MTIYHQRAPTHGYKTKPNYTYTSPTLHHTNPTQPTPTRTPHYKMQYNKYDRPYPQDLPYYTQTYNGLQQHQHYSYQQHMPNLRTYMQQQTPRNHKKQTQHYLDNLTSITDTQDRENIDRIHKIITLLHHINNISEDDIILTEPPPAIARMTEYLTSFIKPALSNDNITQKLIENNKKWAHTTLEILLEHNTETLDIELDNLLDQDPANFEPQFTAATDMARQHRGKRLKEETITMAKDLVSSHYGKTFGDDETIDDDEQPQPEITTTPTQTPIYSPTPQPKTTTSMTQTTPTNTTIDQDLMTLDTTHIESSPQETTNTEHPILPKTTHMDEKITQDTLHYKQDLPAQPTTLNPDIPQLTHEPFGQTSPSQTTPLKSVPSQNTTARTNRQPNTRSWTRKQQIQLT